MAYTKKPMCDRCIVTPIRTSDKRTLVRMARNENRGIADQLRVIITEAAQARGLIQDGKKDKADKEDKIVKDIVRPPRTIRGSRTAD